MAWQVISMHRYPAILDPGPASAAPSLKQPLAYIPIVFSLIAFTITVVALLHGGVLRGVVAHEVDEGTVAHIFQLCMTASAIMSVTFVMYWLARDRGKTLRILAIQILFALVALAPVFYFKL